MSAALLDRMRELIQQDIGRRGLAHDPHENLFTVCRDDFAAACRSLAESRDAKVAIVTGFWIAGATPPAPETDGPLGALFLARALTKLGMGVRIVTDSLCLPALRTLPAVSTSAGPELTHLISLERVGPSHTPASISAQAACTPETVKRFKEEVPPAHHDRCHNWHGEDITERTNPLHLLFEDRAGACITIGIGDGGNEIGMGKIPWEVIRRNIPRGGLIACRVPVNHLIVAGISNWGAYALAAGVSALRGQPLPAELCDIERERELLRQMVESGPLVDGVTGRPAVSVDGLPFDEYAKPLRRLGEFLGV